MADACTDPQPPHIFGYYADQSKYFRVVACFQEVAHHCKDWDPVYCTSLLIYCVAAVINELLIAYVLYYYKMSLLGESFFLKLKTWILLICMVLYAVEFVRNFFESLPWKVSLGLLYLEQVCRLLVYVLICHFFLKAAASLIGKKRVRKWRKSINIFTLVVLGFLAVLFAYYVFRMFIPSENSKAACHTYEFMI